MKADITHVLIIDDDVDTCFLLNRILSRMSINVVCVNTLQQAKDTLETMQPSLIFIDNNLPDGYGLNFIPLIREKYPKTQIVMITAHSNDFNRKTALLNGAAYFMPKPFSADDIYRIIESVASQE